MPLLLARDIRGTRGPPLEASHRAADSVAAGPHDRGRRSACSFAHPTFGPQRQRAACKSIRRTSRNPGHRRRQLSRFRPISRATRPAARARRAVPRASHRSFGDQSDAAGANGVTRLLGHARRVAATFSNRFTCSTESYPRSKDCAKRCSDWPTRSRCPIPAGVPCDTEPDWTIWSRKPGTWGYSGLPRDEAAGRCGAFGHPGRRARPIVGGGRADRHDVFEIRSAASLSASTMLDDHLWQSPPEDSISLLISGVGAHLLLATEQGLHALSRGVSRIDVRRTSPSEKSCESTWDWLIRPRSRWWRASCV